MGRLIMLDIKQIIKDSAHVKTAMLDACAPDIQKGAQVMIDAIKASGKILWCGNGGSAADAQHMAAELMADLGDVRICIPSDDTQRIQECHLLAEHILCESVEAAIMGN